MSILSCAKENAAPTSPTNFSIDIGGSSTEYIWYPSTDADGDAITYDISVLDAINSTPLVIATNVSTNTYTSPLTPLNIPTTMIVTAKDGNGGTTTGVEKPDITL